MVNVVEQLAGTLWVASRTTSSSIVNFTSAISGKQDNQQQHHQVHQRHHHHGQPALRSTYGAGKHNYISAQVSSSTTIIIMWVDKSKSFVTCSIFIGKVKMYKDSFLWQLGMTHKLSSGFGP